MDLAKWVENKKIRRTVKILSYITLLIVVAADFVIERHHTTFLWDKIPGFGAFYGFISCVLIIVISKALGSIFISKKEDYYD